MAKKKKATTPEQVYLYVCGIDRDGNHEYAVATRIEDIPEDGYSDQIGVYERVREAKLVVTRDLA